MKYKNIIVLGKSGAGKGTQLKLLNDYLTAQGEKTLYISIGELLRHIGASATFAGKKIKQIIDNGILIDEWVAIYLWQNDVMTRMTDNSEIVFFDGSPRKLHEAEKLDALLEWFERKEDTVAVLLDTGHEEVFQRLKARGRTDDTDHAITSRLEWFDTEVMPVVRYYESTDRLVTVNGEGTINEVHMRMRTALGLHK
ncbi:MAG: nucleoside monophosphate kinase [Patescibacteria group bacterium]|nr:nucleoside monophosphate kinase [Patescibacteria group bacterium]MDE2437827.1 nucleoside monophosphate kinase [Patescibacteria group bacterium]